MAHRLQNRTGGLFNWKALSFQPRCRAFRLIVTPIPAEAYPKKCNPYPGFFTPDQHLLFHRILSNTCRVLVRGREDGPGLKRFNPGGR